MGGIKLFTKYILLVIAGFVVLGLIFPRSKNPSAEEYRSGTYCIGGFDGSFSPLKDAITAKLRDQDSFKFVDTTITPLDTGNSHIVKMTYRARNGFGGMNLEVVRARVGADCSLLEILDD